MTDAARTIIEVAMLEPLIVHPDQLLRIATVKQLTGLGRSAIYERMSLGAFPLARNLGGNAVAWPAGEVLDWIRSLPQVSIQSAKRRT